MKTKHRVHNFMMDFQKKNGIAPTMEEIAKAIDGLNHRSSVLRSLRSLEKDGEVMQTAPPLYKRRYMAREGIRYQAQDQSRTT